MKANNLTKITNRKKRIGRGYGSGKGGHTATRGQKGQLSRSGHKSMVFFEGGNLPFYKRIPKFRGGKIYKKEKTQVFNVGTLNELFADGETITVATLKKKNLVRKKASVKILGDGSVDKKFTIKGLALSETAREKILKAGGSVEK